MKTNKIELDVDFIGEQVPLKPEDEKAFSDYFRQRQLASRRVLNNSKVKTTNQTNPKES